MTKRAHNDRQLIMKNYPLVSITITTKNEEKNIADCLESIKQQTYPKIEIIIVDNNSIDKTKKIARKYTKKVFNKGPERSAQRNFGMLRKSKGKYLMFLDADMVLSKTVISKAVNKLENSSLSAFYIPEIVLGDGFWSRVRRFERSFYDGTVIDCTRIIKKDIFIKSGGFDSELIGSEDWDLDKRIKKIGKVGLLSNKKAIIYHNEADFNLRNYLRKKKYYSGSFNKYIKKWGRDDPDVKKQFSPFYRCFIVFTEKGKWKKIVKNPFLFLGVYILKMGLGIIYLLSLFKKNEL